MSTLSAAEVWLLWLSPPPASINQVKIKAQWHEESSDSDIGLRRGKSVYRGYHDDEIQQARDHEYRQSCSSGHHGDSSVGDVKVRVLWFAKWGVGIVAKV